MLKSHFWKPLVKQTTTRSILFKRFASETKIPLVTSTKKLITEQTEYKQLPEDSQYIEKFYVELSAFQKEIKENKEIPFVNFTDFGRDPNALIHHLEQFIQTKVYSQWSTDNPDGILVVKRYNEFLNNVKITLRLNGGHTHIFDILLQNKKLFETFDILKREIARRRKQEEVKTKSGASKS